MVGGALEIYQDSSGGENWDSRNHVNREGRVPCSFRGYRVRAGGREESGLRASPAVAVAGTARARRRGDPRVLAAVPQGAGGRGPDPAGPAVPRPVRRPLRAPGRRAEDAHPLARLRPGRRGRGPGARLGPPAGPPPRDARLVRRLRRHPHLVPSRPDRAAAWRRSWPGSSTGPRSFFARREVIDEYGWRHFGEVYADHEAAYYQGEPPIISHYNNQYDLVYGMILQYCRTGDAAGSSCSTRWPGTSSTSTSTTPTGTSRPTTAACSGTPTTTATPPPAPTAPTRGPTAPAGGGPYGGGPCDEHNYTTGLLHYYYLTGDERPARRCSAWPTGSSPWTTAGGTSSACSTPGRPARPAGPPSRATTGPAAGPATRSTPCSTAGCSPGGGPTWTRPRR